LIGSSYWCFDPLAETIVLTNDHDHGPTDPNSDPGHYLYIIHVPSFSTMELDVKYHHKTNTYIHVRVRYS